MLNKGPQNLVDYIEEHSNQEECPVALNPKRYKNKY
jgi:hypothetical protein